MGGSIFLDKENEIKNTYCYISLLWLCMPVAASRTSSIMSFTEKQFVGHNFHLLLELSIEPLMEEEILTVVKAVKQFFSISGH